MKRTAIEDLICGLPPQDLTFDPKTKIYKTARQQRRELGERIKDALSSDNQKLLDEYDDASMHFCTEENNEAYRQGFSMGVRLVSEAFVIGEANEDEG